MYKLQKNSKFIWAQKNFKMYLDLFGPDLGWAELDQSGPGPDLDRTWTWTWTELDQSGPGPDLDRTWTWTWPFQ